MKQIKLMFLLTVFFLAGCSVHENQIGKENDMVQTKNRNILSQYNDYESVLKNKKYIIKNGEMWASAIVEKLEKGETANYKKSQVLFAIYFCINYYKESEKICNVLLANKIKIAKLAHITPELYTFYMRD